jgi:hypothetical protein
MHEDRTSVDALKAKLERYLNALARLEQMVPKPDPTPGLLAVRVKAVS